MNWYSDVDCERCNCLADNLIEDMKKLIEKYGKDSEIGKDVRKVMVENNIIIEE